MSEAADDVQECDFCAKPCARLKRFSGKSFDSRVCGGECMAAMQRHVLYTLRSGKSSSFQRGI